MENHQNPTPPTMTPDEAAVTDYLFAKLSRLQQSVIETQAELHNLIQATANRLNVANAAFDPATKTFTPSEAHHG